MPKKSTLTVEERFWTHVDKSGDCWLWVGAGRGQNRAYGGFTIVHGKSITAHRFAYEITYGKIPPGMCICHKCDNRKCVRPEHLFLGTLSDNTQDMINKGRSGIPRKLTAQQVRDILYDYETNGIGKLKLSKKYGITRNAIRDILKGRTYQDITEGVDRMKVKSRRWVQLLLPW